MITKNKKNILSISVGVIYIICIAYFIISLAASYNIGKLRSQEIFTDLTKSINTSLYRDKVGTVEFRDSFYNMIDKQGLFQSVQLKHENTLLATYPIHKVTGSTSSLIKTYSTVIMTSDNNRLTLTAGIYLLTPYIIYTRAKYTFAVLFITTLAYIILLLVFTKLDAGSVTKTADGSVKPSAANTESDSGTEETLQNQDVLPAEDTVQEPADEPAEKTEQAGIVPADITEENTVESADLSKPEEVTVEQTEVSTQEEVQSETEHEDSAPTPQSILTPEEVEALLGPMETEEQDPFASITEEPFATVEAEPVLTEKKTEFEITAANSTDDYDYKIPEELKEYLELELKQANSSSQDLSVIAVSIENLQNTDPISSMIKRLFSTIITSSDHVFEYNNDSYILVASDCDIDKSLFLCQNLYVRTKQLLKDNNRDNKITIGLSSKTIRIVSAERIFNEAMSALDKAKNDIKDYIVSFKVDPDKYKEFINKD